MLDIGWSELLVIAIVAVVVVGPKDLPRLMRTVGRYTSKARGLAREFRASFEELGRETELEEINREMERIRREDPIRQRTNAIAPPLPKPAKKGETAPAETKESPPASKEETRPPSKEATE
ncbi:MAG: Sec-independent protein translocase protein TatB [Hyphomicrobiales bacterium]|nr:Sec-independent protein translocase protein TatB [Hyphomicrobiales bacterium]MCY4048176.1 Sec-independent protein translocase protein TatB [Hyphomicrobiales bacterium]MCY4053808.1 Sec-independent protein translocase protein TatB [Hyphomicrobiales bacterium]